ncbi:hypothetical protein Asru_0729_03 [Acidisphaera rubrifaciens HS-AP3]|uniref:Uncharacterized protein n=1 Tax=Acidisphaera rubrifaciens HS-AP3 TaxID=1231350 RepID=A0A0D6PBQ4_9PROT|nr:hypothetical protein Asru_0729_03 [Acidisphaera rubrifaciens HS-AP3]
MLLLLAGARGARAQGDPDGGDPDAGREFPKTLILDEPGIDDEISLPTLSRIGYGAAPGAPGYVQNGVAFEVDKTITERIDLQLTGGYLDLAGGDGRRRDGWDDLALTSKYVVVQAPESETIVTLGLTRSFGGTGAARVGAERSGSTAPTLYVGQGLGTAPVAAAWRPFAVTGTLAYEVPDDTHAGAGARFPQTLQIAGSVQYSLHYLAPWIVPWAARAGLADWVGTGLTRLIPIVEASYAVPTTDATGSDARQGLIAPGLIYAGEGYQLAVEALVPLTRASGTSVGVIAQLNLSFRAIGLGALARPLF